MQELVMADLFRKITQGSILLFNVDEPKDLPTRKQLKTHLNVTDFIYYQSDGHHRGYIHQLRRLKKILNPNSASTSPYGYRAEVEASHFLFCEQEIKFSSAFGLIFTGRCIGSYFVNKQNLSDLASLIRTYEHACEMQREIKRWPETILNHKENLLEFKIEDAVIANLDEKKITELTKNYGAQAVTESLQNLNNWKDTHSWKAATEPAGSEDEEPEEANAI